MKQIKHLAGAATLKDMAGDRLDAILDEHVSELAKHCVEAESAGEALQKAQYGARNDAWIAVDDARQEVQFLRAHPPARPHMHTLAPARATLRSLCLQADADEYSELRDALRRARAAFDSYLALAPAELAASGSGTRNAGARDGCQRR